jgi:hypothetical protein
MTAWSTLRRSALRCAAAAAAICGAMLAILGWQGRLDGVRELFSPPPSAEPLSPSSGAPRVALPSLAASTAFFSVPAPCDAAELSALERDLVALRERQRELVASLEQRERALAERERSGAEREDALARAEAELRDLAERLERRAAELERELALFDAASEPAERRAARLLAEMDPAAAAAALAAQSDPLQAARVFAQLPADQQAPIAAAFDAEQRARIGPAWLRIERARRAASSRSAR